MIKNSIEAINKPLKVSKFTFTCINNEGDLLLYNFKIGLSSLVKVNKSEKDKFIRKFISCPKIEKSTISEYSNLSIELFNKGILVYDDFDEGMGYDADRYEEIYDNRLHVTILPTGKCNFKCTYCLEAEQPLSRERLSEEKKRALIKYVQKSIHDFKGLHVIWYGGEPLLELQNIKDLSDKFMKICNSRCIPYTAQMITNGYLLTENVFEELYNRKVYHYMITIDGFRNQHDKYRCRHDGMGTYDEIMTNLKNIRDKKKYRFATITIRINISQEVLEVLDDFILYLDETFSEDPRFSYSFIPVENYSQSKPIDESIFVKREKVLDSLDNNQTYIEKLKPKYLEYAHLLPNSRCVASLKNSYIITPDLKVYKCHAHFDMEDNSLGRIDLDGNIYVDNQLNKKWYLIDGFNKNSDDACEECFYKPACFRIAHNCPYRFIEGIDYSNGCPIKNDGFIDMLKEGIVKASDNNPCYIASL